MLIVSKQHDYYDTAMAMGIDKTCVYRRAEEEVEVEKPASRRKHNERKPEESLLTQNWRFINYKERPHRDVSCFQSKLIGFCGSVFPAIEITLSSLKFTSPRIHFYDIESALKALKEHGILRVNRKSYSWLSEWTEAWVREFFSHDWKAFTGLFLQHKVPVFLVQGEYYKHANEHRYTLNPVLKDHGFVTVKDPFTAFQEIHQFLSGKLGSEDRPMIKIDDKHRIEAHGFNKRSFRKESTKKKRK